MGSHTVNGKFISFEGVEGVGKSTIIRKIGTWLKYQNIDIVKTLEPGGTKVANRIRRILLDNHHETMTPEAEACMMFASRAQHIRNLIVPSLKLGRWVLSDRFVDSSYAYQVAGRGVPLSVVAMLDEWVCAECQPDVVYIMDMSVEQARKRISHRSLDRIEKEADPFFNAVREAFLERSRVHPDRIIVVDAGQSIDAVLRHIKSDMRERFGVV